LAKSPKLLWDPNVHPKPLERIQLVPIEVKPYIGPKRQDPINAGTVPPNFVHSWALDVAGLANFKLHFKDLQLDWGSGDRVSVLDSDGQLLQSFSSQYDIDGKNVTIQGASGGPQRIYLVLETSQLETQRRFKLLGFRNVAHNTGQEEALLSGDDLNYDERLGPFFEAFDPQTGKPFPVYQPWLPSGPHTFMIAWPKPNRRDGWYLVGKNVTEKERGFLSLVYYNERRGLLRAYLFNLNLSTDVTGYLVTFLLRGRDGPQFVDLEGAFFSQDPRPQKWSSAVVVVPLWPSRTWAFVEAPMLYPMAKALPSKQGPSGSLPAHYYSSVYEDRSTEGHRNILLRVMVQGYMEGEVTGDIVGQAIGEAIQAAEAESGLSIMDLAKGAASAYSMGKDWYDAGKGIYQKAKDYYDKLVKAGTPNTQVLGGLVSLGASAWGGALAVVGVGIAIYQMFSDAQRLRLGIQLSLKAHLTGSVGILLQVGFHDFYLPGRFSVLEAASEGPLNNMGYLAAKIPRYDRTMGLFGLRYDPAMVEITLLQTYYARDPPANTTRYVFPSTPNPVRQDPPTPNGRAVVERWLPVIYNPYAEIAPIKPKLISVEGAHYDADNDILYFSPPPGANPCEPWFKWVHDVSPSANIAPEQDDSAFPANEVAYGDGPRMHLKVFSVQPSAILCSYSNNPKLSVTDGIWLEVDWQDLRTPSTYRSFADIENVRTHKHWDVEFSELDPVSGGQWSGSSEDPFPLHDIVYYWDIPYFYYGRTRKANGIVPLSRENARIQSPIGINCLRQGFNYTDDDGVWFYLSTKQRSALLRK